MVEENKTGTEDTGDADQKAGNNDAAADGQQGDTQDAAGNQEVEGLKAAAVAEREKRQAAESEAQSLRDQMALINAQQTQIQASQTQKQTSLSQSVAKQLGIDLELATPEEICQINEGVLQIISGQQSEQSFINSHPDYAEVVGVQGPGGPNDFRPAPPLMRALKANPALANALQNSPNKAVLAYGIASNDPQYLADKAEAAKSDDTKAAEKAEAKIKAANQQLSVSAAKTGGGNLDDAARRAAQTDEEFLKENEEIMARAQ